MTKTLTAPKAARITSEKVKRAKAPAPLPDAMRERMSLLDWLERVLVLGFYVWFFWRYGSYFLANPTWSCGILLFTESLSVLFLLIRQPAKSISTSLGPWAIALGATLTPLMTVPAESPLGPVELGETLMLVGALTLLVAKTTLGRCFGLVAAHRGIKNSGAYRLVRHPIYASYMLCHLGLLYLNPSLWNLGVLSFCLGLQIGRIFLEEKILSVDPHYRAYQAAVPYRLIPGVF